MGASKKADRLVQVFQYVLYMNYIYPHILFCPESRWRPCRLLWRVRRTRWRPSRLSRPTSTGRSSTYILFWYLFHRDPLQYEEAYKFYLPLNKSYLIFHRKECVKFIPVSAKSSVCHCGEEKHSNRENNNSLDTMETIVEELDVNNFQQQKPILWHPATAIQVKQQIF